MSAAAPTAVFYPSQKFKMLTASCRASRAVRQACELLLNCCELADHSRVNHPCTYKYTDVLLLHTKISTQHYQKYEITTLLSMHSSPELGYNSGTWSTNYNKFLSTCVQWACHRHRMQSPAGLVVHTYCSCGSLGMARRLWRVTRLLAIRHGLPIVGIKIEVKTSSKLILF